MTDDDAAMLCFGVRYCLGRATYAPGLCCDVLRRRWPELKPGDRGVILRDVRREVERPKGDHEFKFDEDTWAVFAAWASARPEAIEPDYLRRGRAAE